MKISIKDKIFGQENYECNVYIDGVKQDVGSGRYKEFYCSKSSEVKIEYINNILKEKQIGIIGLFYWIISIIGGSTEPHPFGLPFDAVLRIACVEDKDIVIEVNDDWKNTPFQIEGNCVVLENVCISSKSDKKKWILLDVLPLFLITLFIFVIVYFAIQV